MTRLLIMLFAMLLPLQFAWSAASAYCQHETAEASSLHVGHHFHAHDGDSKSSAANPLAADPDCASCHAGGAPVITARPAPLGLVASGTPTLLAAMPPFSSALARAPDRPQWLRLV